MSGLIDRGHPLCVDMGTWNPTFGECRKLGHAQWLLAVYVRGDRLTRKGGEWHMVIECIEQLYYFT